MNLEHIDLLLKKIDTAVALIENLKRREKNYIVEIAKLKAKNRILEKENIGYQSELKKTDAMHEQLESKIQEILQHIPDNIDDIENVDIDNIENIDVGDSSPETIIEHEQEDSVNISIEDNDEERIKNLMDNPDNFEKKDLFVEEEEKNEKSDEPNETLNISSISNISLKETPENTKSIEKQKKQSINNGDNDVNDEQSQLSRLSDNEKNNEKDENLPEGFEETKAIEEKQTINFEETLLNDDKNEINLEFNVDADNEELPRGVL